MFPRILVVEDDDSIRTFLVSALRRQAFEVDEAKDGDDAIRLAGTAEYAVILLDLMLPGSEGFEFLDRFQRSEVTRRSVVIVTTAFDDRVIGRLSPRRVHAVFRKPFDLALLVELVREIVTTWTRYAMPLLAADDAERAAERA
jgi:DNA-binding response OmpR family regulator